MQVEKQHLKFKWYPCKCHKGREGQSRSHCSQPNISVPNVYILLFEIVGLARESKRCRMSTVCSNQNLNCQLQFSQLLRQTVIKLPSCAKTLLNVQSRSYPQRQSITIKPQIVNFCSLHAASITFENYPLNSQIKRHSF